MQKEYTQIDGLKFTRYPEAIKRNHRVYFLGPNIKGKRETLHRYLYRTKIGKIPKGYLVHHKNHNPLDNSLDNLGLMTRGEHQRMHAKDMWAKADKAKRKRMKPPENDKKYVWHRSAEGRKQLSLKAKNEWKARKR